MGLFSRKKVQSLPSSKNVEHGDKTSTERDQFYLLAILALLRYIKKFSFDLKEIGASAFKDDIDKLGHRFESEQKTSKIKRLFEAYDEGIVSFIEREKAYFFNKDTELKDIIKILTKGIATINQENQLFNSRIQEENLKLERITKLDDLRRIKSALAEEVALMKVYIEKKQGQDARHMQTLSNEVEDLKIELRKTKSASQIDGLSGAYNRAAFDARMNELLVEPGRPFSLLMLDIDDFKIINDTWGHRIGDRVIVALVQKCKHLIRKDDFLARYGGEEFAVILPEASLSQAVKKADMLCKAIAEAKYAMEGSNQKAPLSFTASFGVCTLQKNDTMESLIERADKALYKAKAAGKKRVVSERDLD